MAYENISKITFQNYSIYPYKHYTHYPANCTTATNQSLILSPGAIVKVLYTFRIGSNTPDPNDLSGFGVRSQILNGTSMRFYFKQMLFSDGVSSDPTTISDTETCLYIDCDATNVPTANGSIVSFQIPNPNPGTPTLLQYPSQNPGLFNLGGWRLTVTCNTDGGTFCLYFIAIEGFAIMSQDMEGYIIGNNAQLNKSFTYNTKSSSTVLENQLISVYNSVKAMRMGFWIKWFTSTGSKKYTYQKGQINIGNRWYNSDINGTPLTDIANPKFTFFRPTESGQEVSDLSPTEDTRVQFTFTQGTYSEVNADAILIQVGGSSNPTDNILRASNHTIREIVNNTFDNDPTNPLPYIDGGFNDYNPDDYLIPILRSKNGQGNRIMGKAQRPTSNFNGVADDWSLYFNIPNEQLSGSIIYRIVIVLYCRQLGDNQCFTTYSFISNPIMATGLPTLCPPECGGFFSDYLDTFGQRLIVSPQERIKATCFWRAARFELCREQYGHQMIASAKQVKVTILEEIDGYRHIFDEIVATKVGGAFISQNDDLKVYILPDAYLREIRVAYTYRIRYEADILNLRSESLATGATIFPPAANQDWTNRNLIIEFQLILEHTLPVLFQDILVKRMFFYVHPYDDHCLDIKFVNSAGFEMSNFCSFEESFNVIVTQCPDDDPNMPQDDEGGTINTGPGYDYFIGAIDKQNYSINQIKEHESITEGPISQLTNAPISSIDEQFEHNYDSGSDNQAMATCDANGFESGQQYRFVAIKKKTPPAKIPCNDPNIRSGGGQDFLIFNIELENPGIVVLWFDMFGVPDAARLMWGGLCLFRTYQPKVYTEPYNSSSLSKFGPITQIEYPANNSLPVGGIGTGVPEGDIATYDVNYLPDAIPRIGAFTFDYQPQNYPGYPTSVQLLMSGIGTGTGWNGGLLCGMQIVPFNTWANKIDFRFTPNLLAPNGDTYARKVVSNAVGKWGAQGTNPNGANYMYNADGTFKSTMTIGSHINFDPRMYYYIICVELGSKEQLQQVFGNDAVNGVWITPCFNDGSSNNTSFNNSNNIVQRTGSGSNTVGLRCKSPFSESDVFYSMNEIDAPSYIPTFGIDNEGSGAGDSSGYINSRSEMHIYTQKDNINYDAENWNPSSFGSGITDFTCSSGNSTSAPPSDFLRGNTRPKKQYVMLSNGPSTLSNTNSKFGLGYQTCYQASDLDAQTNLGYPNLLMPKATTARPNLYKDYFFWDGVYSATNPVHYAVIVIKNIDNFMFNFEVYPNV